MKKYIMNISILIILFIIVISIPCTTKAIETDIRKDEFVNSFNPLGNGNSNDISGQLAEPIMGSIVDIASEILGILQVIGGIGTVVSIALFGFKRILSSDRYIARELGIYTGGVNKNIRIDLEILARGLIIGGVLLFFSTTIVKIVLHILMG